MREQLEWKDIYKLWKLEGFSFSESLSTPVSVETIFVKYHQDGYIFGYDWLKSSEAVNRKLLIEQHPEEFLYFTKPTNKGTIQTAEMLVDAQSEEERAAIWIAATAKELYESSCGNGIGPYAHLLYLAACDFLKTRYYLWHHAMRGLVPEIVIPPSILDSIVCKDAAPVIGLILMNTALVKNDWRILRYSSLADGAVLESRYRITKT